MQMPTVVEPGLEFVVTATLIVADVGRSVAFYRDVLGAEVLRTGEPTFLRLGNLGLTINVGGGPNDVHTVGRSASTTKPAKILVLLVKNQGAPVVVPVSP